MSRRLHLRCHETQVGDRDIERSLEWIMFLLVSVSSKLRDHSTASHLAANRGSTRERLRIRIWVPYGHVAHRSELACHLIASYLSYKHPIKSSNNSCGFLSRAQFYSQTTRDSTPEAPLHLHRVQTVSDWEIASDSFMTSREGGGH